MSTIGKTEYTRLLQDEDFKNKVLDQALAAPGVLQDLAEDVADDLSDVFESDPLMQKEMLARAMQSDEFKQTVVQKLIEDLG